MAATTPLVTIPRTVLIETFTGVWCHFCPEETQALHYIDLSTPRTAVVIAELHVCAFPPGSGPCLENYVPPDKTSDTRGLFYNVCGYPHVFFDGDHSICGAVGTVAQTQTKYYQYIANASRFPGNVSISESATVVSGNVTLHATVNSAITGTYNAVSYLMERIDKQNQSNGYGPHDVDSVVRATLLNHPVSLVAGSATQLSAQGALLSTWNTLNLSVITFIQENSTKIVENANTALVTTLSTAMTANQTTLFSGGNAKLSLQVGNTSTGAPLAGAAVTLASNAGGTFTPASGVTAADGSFVSVFQAPTVLTTTTITVTATVAAAGYTPGSALSTLVVNPIIVPLVPTGLTLVPGKLQVTLNWTPPASGATGLLYHVYRSTCLVGVYSEIGNSNSPAYVDSGLTAGHCYWYKVSAENSGGFSVNTTVISATGVTVVTQGLPSSIGWWIDIDTANFSSHTNGSLSLYLPSGSFSYEVGPRSYAFLATASAGPLVVSQVPLTIAATFLPRYASLHAVVTPSTATVTLNGVAVALTSGTFDSSLTAGTYYLNVSAPGYVANASTVFLTPGNLSDVQVALQQVPSTPGSSSVFGGALSGTDAIVLVVGIIAAAGILGAAIVVTARRKRAQPTRRRATPPPSEPSSTEEDEET
ncbi:MAG: PEGA domain-containing protein [Thermoplasmata archaeon]|nr:PEGA domain-containing protein [Thermoplasmata archaeon]